MKGIVDPWRVVEPLRKAAKPPVDEKKKIDVDEIDYDEDLKPIETCRFDSKHGSIVVSGKNIVDSNTGLRALVQGLLEIQRTPEGKRLIDDTGAVLGFDIDMLKPGFKSEGPRKAVLYFMSQPFDTGMLALIRALNLLQSRTGPTGAALIKRLGITTTLR